MKQIDKRTIKVENVRPDDGPKYSDAYISYAQWTDGSSLNSHELDMLTNQYDLLHEAINNHLCANN